MVQKFKTGRVVSNGSLMRNSMRLQRSPIPFFWQLDQRFSDLSFFGVSASVEESVWTQIESEHIELKTARFKRENQLDEIPKSKLDLSVAMVRACRGTLKNSSMKFLEQVQAAKRDCEKVNKLIR